MKTLLIIVSLMVCVRCGNSMAENLNNKQQNNMETKGNLPNGNGALDGEGITLYGVPKVQFHKCIKPGEASTVMEECKKRISDLLQDLGQKQYRILRIENCSAARLVGSCTFDSSNEPTTVAGSIYFY